MKIEQLLIFRQVRKCLSFNSTTKFKIAIVLIILSVLFSSLEKFNREIRQLLKKTQDADEITLLEIENRFKVFKNILPEHGAIGYITDQQLQDSVREFYLAQYVLSPVIIVNKSTYPLVIGNFHKPINVDKVSEDMHLSILKEFNNGLFLFKATR